MESAARAFDAEGDVYKRQDNYFLEKSLRFTNIEEDEPIACPLCNEYENIF